jgi:DNA-binding response OmpR family regulator
MKPYREKEILATIRMVLSQKEKQNILNQSHIVKLKNNFYFDTQRLVLTKDNKQIPLTPSQSKLIEVLVKNLNTTISNEYICNFIWGEYREGNTLRSLIHRTKQTIGENLINNIKKVGYSITV